MSDIADLERRIEVLEHLLHLHLGLDVEDVDLRIAKEQRIRERLATMFPPDEAEAWLTTPHPALDDERPLDLIRTGKYARVSTVIDAL